MNRIENWGEKLPTVSIKQIIKIIVKRSVSIFFR